MGVDSLSRVTKHQRRTRRAGRIPRAFLRLGMLAEGRDSAQEGRGVILGQDRCYDMPR